MREEVRERKRRSKRRRKTEKQAVKTKVEKKKVLEKITETWKWIKGLEPTTFRGVCSVTGFIHGAIKRFNS